MLPKTDNKINSGIYAIICRNNGISYPGRAQNILIRYRRHLNKLRKNNHHCSHLQNAFNLYGENSLFIIIVENDVPKDQLKIREQIYLDFVRENRGLFFNSSYSSEGIEHTEKTKEKFQKTWEIKRLNGYIHPNKGIPLTEEHKKTLSNSRKELLKKGFIVHNKGKPMSDKQKEQVRISHLGKKASEKTKQKQSIAHSGKNNHFFGLKHTEKSLLKMRIPIKQINPINNEVIKIWNSTTEAATHFNITNGAIRSVLKKKSKTCKGFKWEYLETELMPESSRTTYKKSAA